MFPRRKPSSLHLETLEARHALAGDVMAVMYGQMLVIWGDAADNGALLTYDSSTASYTVTGVDLGGSPTTINGGAAATLTGVQQIAVLMNGGNDAFAVGSPAAVDMVINQWLAIDMGDGDDSLQLGRAGNVPGGSDPVALSLRTGTSVAVDLGAGNDQMQIANADIGLALNIAGGDGNDNVDFATEFTPAGGDASISPIRVRGGATISMGGGEDTLSIKNALIGQTLQILDGAGAAHIEIDNVSIGKNLDVDTSGSADQISINFVNAKAVTFDTNSGSDNLEFLSCKFKTLIVKLGSDHDALRIKNTQVTRLTRLDGGSEGCHLTGGSNSLRGLTRRNMG